MIIDVNYAFNIQCSMSVFLNTVHALLRLHKMILTGKGKTVLLSSKSTFLYLNLLSQLEPVNISPLPGGAMLDAVHRGCWWDRKVFLLGSCFLFLTLVAASGVQDTQWPSLSSKFLRYPR